MAIFVGNRGAIKLSRSAAASFSGMVESADVNTTLNRVGLDAGTNELITGDAVEISTTDPRGLEFLAASAWDSGSRQTQGTFYINVNAVGGVRFFSSFDNAVANNRNAEKTVATFAGDPIPIEVRVKDSQYRDLAQVQSYRFSTDRDALDTTSLSDGFREQHSGLVTGSGSLDVLFDYRLKAGETSKEVALAIYQVITRLKLGSRFGCLLYVREANTDLGETSADSIFYEFEAVVTRAGIDASADRIVQASIDFVTTGEFYLKVGESSSTILTENDDRLLLEAGLGYLLQEISD